MKKRFFPLLIVLSALNLRLNAQSGPGFFQKGLFSVKPDFILKSEEPENSSWSIASASALYFRDFKFKGAVKTPQTTFSLSPDDCSTNWSAEISGKNLLHFPLILRAGKINATGSIAHLKNPGLSGLNSFSSGNLNASSLTSGLSTSSAFSRPDGFYSAIDYDFNFRHLKNLTFSFFADSDDNRYASFFSEFSFSKNVSSKLSFTGAFFDYEKSSSSWFSNEPLFPETKLFSGSAEFSLFSKPFRFRFRQGFYRSSFGENGFTFQEEAFLKAGFFSFYAGNFHVSSTEIYLPSQKKLSDFYQFEINPYFTFFLFQNTIKLKAGAAFRDETDGKSFASAFSFQKEHFSSSINYTRKYEKNQSVEGKISIQSGLNWNLTNRFSFPVFESLEENSKVTTTWNTSFSVESPFSPRKKTSLNAKAVNKITFEDGNEKSGTSKIVFGIKCRKKRLSLNAETALQVNW